MTENPQNTAKIPVSLYLSKAQLLNFFRVSGLMEPDAIELTENIYANPEKLNTGLHCEYGGWGVDFQSLFEIGLKARMCENEMEPLEAKDEYHSYLGIKSVKVNSVDIEYVDLPKELRDTSDRIVKAEGLESLDEETTKRQSELKLKYGSNANHSI